MHVCVRHARREPSTATGPIQDATGQHEAIWCICSETRPLLMDARLQEIFLGKKKEVVFMYITEGHLEVNQQANISVNRHTPWHPTS